MLDNCPSLAALVTWILTSIVTGVVIHLIRRIRRKKSGSDLVMLLRMALNLFRLLLTTGELHIRLLMGGTLAVSLAVVVLILYAFFGWACRL